MKHDIESRLQRDALLVEREAPERILSGLRGRLEFERAPEPAVTSSRMGGLLAAAVILVAAGGLVWGLRSLGKPEGVGDGDHASVASTTMQGSSGASFTLFALPGPSQGLALASRASEPLSREWESMKQDSVALLRGFERQIPRLAPRD
jgi:hypothetical protein